MVDFYPGHRSERSADVILLLNSDVQHRGSKSWPFACPFMHSLVLPTDYCEVEQQHKARFALTTGADTNQFASHPKAILVACCVILFPVLITAGLVTGTTYLTSYVLNSANNSQALTPVLFVYLLAYLLVLVQAIWFACAGSAFCSKTRKKEALAMLVGSSLAGWIEGSGWFAIWRTEALGVMLLLQAVGIFLCWICSVARLF